MKGGKRKRSGGKQKDVLAIYHFGLGRSKQKKMKEKGARNASMQNPGINSKKGRNEGIGGVLKCRLGTKKLNRGGD